jgi:DNA-directed RNA polymerase specialized sigma24 family protein
VHRLYNASMPAAPELLASAQKYRQSAVGALMAAYWPVVHRVAYGLCGDPRAAEQVVDRVMSRALHALPKWRDDTAADRWFYHYTVLETRRYPNNGAAPHDPLLPQSPVQIAEYTAFVKALRVLPSQQQEALILNHGEHLNPRYLGIAMDCSSAAAANHLREGTLQLEQMVGENAPKLMAELERIYRDLSPPADRVRPEIRRRLRRFLLPRRLRRWIVLVLLAAIAWAIWHWRYWIGWKV